MDVATALADLGVVADSIDEEARSGLDRDGYALLPGVLSERQLAVMRMRLGELLAAEGDRAGLEVHQEAGTDRLADLVNKDPAFQVCFTDPRLLACVAHVLGEFKLSSLNFRAALPGRGCRPCTPKAVRSPIQPFSLCAIRSGCWTSSPRITGRPAWCRGRTYPGSHRVT